MKRIVTGLALTAAALVTSVGVATSAQAGTTGYTLQGRYGHNDQCLGIGAYGRQNGQWASYYCTTVTPATWSGPGLYELWVA